MRASFNHLLKAAQLRFRCEPVLSSKRSTEREISMSSKALTKDSDDWRCGDQSKRETRTEKARYIQLDNEVWRFYSQFSCLDAYRRNTVSGVCDYPFPDRS